MEKRGFGLYRNMQNTGEKSTMTEYEKMVRGLIYDPGDAEILQEQVPYQDKLWEFNQLKPSEI